ncbi:MAG: FapA family protein [Spirochaetaceae bacterium]|nr:FapA family protein [Spirochaetaceae bacterium]
MVDFVQLQHAMKDRLERDRSIHAVDAEGATLEEAAAEAAVLLNLPVRRIEYEVTARGFSGLLGSGAKNWKIRAYERVTAETIEEEKEAAAEAAAETARMAVNKDGEAALHLLYDGVFLKVTPPVGRGRKVNPAAVTQLIAARGISDYDLEKAQEIIRAEAGIYERIGGFQRQPVNDAMVSVDITADEMKVSIIMTPPGLGGCDLSMETLLSFLRSNKVIFGVDEEVLSEYADKPSYKEPVQVAAGIRPADGRDAYIQYNFETDQSKVRLREGSNGRVDFKDLNIIQNVVEGQPLAVKIPAEDGTVGRTVTGKVLPAKNGRDIVLPLGKNVHIADDGVTIVADMNGQVVLSGGKINVEPVYAVQGNVNIKTGNIIFLGNVVISGTVEDGYSVKAAGNIEVDGTVEKAELDAEGDIIVHQGITGKSTGIIRAGRSIWARFIENAQVEAGNMVVVSDGIINSRVDAFKRIVCKGKRASIVGGRLRATEEINAKSIGSPTSGTETICEVGFDPKSKEQLEILEIKKAESEKQLEEIQLNIQTLINIKKQRKSLPEDKEAYLTELMDKRQELTEDLRKNKQETEKIQAFLATLKARGRVSASSKVYPGVKILIRDAKEDVRNEYRAVTFILENGLVRVTKYEEPDEESKKGPDGYFSN